ncbi:PREDICTED: ribonuclease 3-like protein 2 [Camelina sativa]|uniref:Ribonuclease 3-like protein 2 n=1 Tax=Camelina sativa TaxID=90675 RepID=A0ABM0Z0Y4_CAMSA|nr:PREDICTED: ribonuclease 3-like protein 2 [Camelina sativa]
MDHFFSPEYNFPAITPCNLSNPLPPSSSSTPPSLDTHRFYNNALSPSVPPPSVPVSPEMESMEAVEKILNYKFRNKSLLKEALTHTSCTDHPSYERLEFVGDSAIGLAISNYLYLTYPSLEPHELSLLRAANVSTEKLARVALNHGLYRFLRRNAPSLDEKVKEFSDAVGKEDDFSVAHGGLVKAPKVLADLLESLAGAVYVDINFDLQRLWVIFRGLLEPIVTLDDLQKQPQPVSMLFMLCHKHKKRIDIKNSKDGNNSIADIYLDDKFLASGRAENKDIARLIAGKEALRQLSEVLPVEMVIDEDSVQIEFKHAKTKLNEICLKKKWPKPIYSVEEERSSVKGKRFVCSAKIKIPTEENTLYMKGDEQSKIKKAESSAAYHMITALRKSHYL